MIKDINRRLVKGCHRRYYEDFKHYAPVFHGDTLYAESEILDKRESESRPHCGIVTLETTGYNQDDKAVLSFQRSALVLKREHVQPSAAKPPGWPDKPIGTQPYILEQSGYTIQRLLKSVMAY